MLASLVSSATPKAPFIPPVWARLMWQATPSTLGSSKPSTTNLSSGPSSRNFVFSEPGGRGSGRVVLHQLNDGSENKPEPSHDVLALFSKVGRALVIAFGRHAHAFLRPLVATVAGS